MGRLVGGVERAFEDDDIRNKGPRPAQEALMNQDPFPPSNRPQGAQGGFVPSTPDPAANVGEVSEPTWLASPSPNGAHDGDLVGGLFDFSFTTFVTARVLRVLYGLYIAMLGLMLVGGLVTGGMAVLNNSVLSGLFLVAITPILTLMGVVSGRIVFECIAVFFRIAEQLGEINRKMKGR